MPCTSAFDGFVEAFQIRCNEPAAEAAIAEVEKRVRVELPPGLRKHFLTCNGGTPQGRRSNLTLYSLEEAMAYEQVPGFMDSSWRYFPVAENNDSNPICVCCGSPLVGYVVQVRHDDGPRLAFRSLDGFFSSANKSLGRGHGFETESLATDFEGPNRLDADVAIARRLLEVGGDERSDALRFACDLLPDSALSALGEILHGGDEYVCEKVTGRLKRIPGAEAKKLLDQTSDDFDAFVERCAAALGKAGIRTSVVVEYGKKTIGVGSAPVWLNMEMFFGRRNCAFGVLGGGDHAVTGIVLDEIFECLGEL